MDVRITPGILSGHVQAIASKSELHRMLICAAFADGPTEITVSGSAYREGCSLPNDILATAGCLEALGAEIKFLPGFIRVFPSSEINLKENPLLDCGESGSTFRFLLPVAASVSGKVSFTGKGRLPERPISGLSDALKAHGVSFSSDRLPFTVSGKPSGGVYEIPGNISSQYLTGLLLSLPLLEENAEIRLLTLLHSSGYIDITRQVMEAFGVSVIQMGESYRISGHKRYCSPSRISAGGDWSNAAAFLAASALRSENKIECSSLDPDSSQGDRAILQLLEKFGAKVTGTENGITVHADKICGTSIDIDETPDLLPVLAAAACAAQGETVFYNAGRLRLKESDRIDSAADMVRALGGKAETGPDCLVIYGSGSLCGGSVNAANDHRIVMAAAIASAVCTGPVVIRGAEAVDKSYPTFWEDFRAVKGVVNVL